MAIHSNIWLTILGYMALAFTISFFIQRWIRSELRKKAHKNSQSTSPKSDSPKI